MTASIQGVLIVCGTRTEGIEAVCAKLVGTQRVRMVDDVNCLFQNQQAYSSMAQAQNPNGEGDAAIEIAEMLAKLGPNA